MKLSFINTCIAIMASAVLAENNITMDSCEAQQSCIFFIAVASPIGACKNSGCSYEACMYMTMQGDNCPEKITHTCQKPSHTCISEGTHPTGFLKFVNDTSEPYAEYINDASIGFAQCQTVGPNSVVEFLIKDGVGCSGSATLPSGFHGIDATCAPRTSETESCASISSETECVWSYTTPPCPVAQVQGDPHFTTWDGYMYDFHGICDLVLLHNPEFKNGLGMHIHLRSKQMAMWTYVSAAAIRIGSDTFEVRGGKTLSSFWINGVEGVQTESDMILSTIAGYPIRFRKISVSSYEYLIDLGGGEQIVISTWKSMVRAAVIGAKSENFEHSGGLLGSFPEGLKLGRDKSVIEELNDFGQEWQVLSSEPKMFHNVEGPQYPQICEIPSTNEMRRRLGQATISTEEAELACSRVREQERDLCIFDVIATNDKDVAGAY